MTDTVIEVENLVKEFGSGRHASRVLDEVGFTVNRGETVGLVGESGSGKSTTARCILRLIEPTSGVIRFEGEDVLSFGRRKIKEYRARAQMVFQDPYSSLDPRMCVEDIIAEGIHIHRPKEKRDKVRDEIVELLELVGLRPDHLPRRPAAFSGGERQRIGIARALAVRPSLLICDEPVASLDVSIQAQILNLFVRPQVAARVDDDLHRPRPRDGPASVRPHRRHARRQDQGNRFARTDLRRPTRPVHHRADAGRARAGPVAGARTVRAAPDGRGIRGQRGSGDMTASNRLPTVEIGEDRVAVITLHRPDVLNALDSASHIAIGDAIAALERDDNVGAIVIAGEGRAFCSGSDLAEIGQLTGQAEQDYVALDFATKNRIAACTKPVIAAIQGYCVGGGLELALACDFRVAGEDAVFIMPEVSLGSLPGSGGLQRLPRIVGVGVATDWILTGRRVSAEEAERRGLVTRLVPAG